MPPIKLDGKKLAAQLNEETKHDVAVLTIAGGYRLPSLAVILVGADPASQTYVRNKEKACIDANIVCNVYRLLDTTSEDELLCLIDTLNSAIDVDGILVQLPLPKRINKSRVIERISPNKDVDGIHPYNVGLLAAGHALLKPCTPAGIMYLLEQTKVDLTGKEALVIGRSEIVGLPALLLLMAAKATVTTCDIFVRNLQQKVQQADIIVAAAGVMELVKSAWIKPGCIVIDVGIHRQPDLTFKGDVESSVAQTAGWYTPVPGGVGPMTVAMVLMNTLTASINNQWSRERIDRGIFPAYRKESLALAKSIVTQEPASALELGSVKRRRADEATSASALLQLRVPKCI